MSLNISDEGYNNGKKYGQKGTICGPNNDILELGSYLVGRVELGFWAVFGE
jgi:hypothetical protein